MGGMRLSTRETESVGEITRLLMTSRRDSTLRDSKRERERERESEYRQEEGREQELYCFVTGVVHLDCNQGAPRYLYKNVVVCMQARKDLENAWKLLESA